MRKPGVDKAWSHQLVAGTLLILSRTNAKQSRCEYRLVYSKFL